MNPGAGGRLFGLPQAAVASTGALAVGLLLFGEGCSSCHDRVSQTAEGEFAVAEVHERVCGTASAVAVAVLAPGAHEEEGKAADVEPFLLTCTCSIEDVRAAKVRATWTGPRELEVRYTAAVKPVRAETSWNGTTVSYVPAAEDPAGWRQASWGMTVEQAAAALSPKPEAIPATDARLKQWSLGDGTLLPHLWIPDYEMASRHFEVKLGFGEHNGLQMVVISPRDAPGFGPLDIREAMFADLEGELRSEYGTPTLQVNNPERRDVSWRFSRTDVALHLIRFAKRGDGRLALVYEPHGEEERRRREHRAATPQ